MAFGSARIGQQDNGLHIDDNSYNASRRAYSPHADAYETADDQDDQWLDDEEDDLIIDTQNAMFEYPIQIRQTSYSKEISKGQYNATPATNQQKPNATQSASIPKHRRSDTVNTASASDEKPNKNQKGIERKKSSRAVAYACGGIVAFLIYAVTFTFAGLASGFLLAMTPMESYNSDLLGYYLWTLTIKLIIGVPCFIGAAWITARLMYYIPLGYRGEQKYYVTAANVITFFAIIALLGLNIAECIMIAVHAYFIRKYGASLSWISETETTKDERKRKPRTHTPRSYNQKAYLIGLLVMAVVIAAIIGYNVVAARN